MVQNVAVQEEEEEDQVYEKEKDQGQLHEGEQVFLEEVLKEEVRLVHLQYLPIQNNDHQIPWTNLGQKEDIFL